MLQQDRHVKRVKMVENLVNSSSNQHGLLEVRTARKRNADTVLVANQRCKETVEQKM